MLQRQIRAALARRLVARRKADRKSAFCARVVARPLRDSLLALLNAYRRSLHTWAAPLHNKGRRRDHTHVPYELLDSIDGRVKAEEEAEVQREVDRTRRRQLAAEEFLRHCEAQKAEERERERVVDDAAEELLQEQLKLEASTKRNRTIRWLLDSFSKMLPGPLRRSLSPLRERFPVEAKITHADVRARKQGGRSRTVSGVTAANLFSAASSRGQKR